MSNFKSHVGNLNFGQIIGGEVVICPSIKILPLKPILNSSLEQGCSQWDCRKALAFTTVKHYMHLVIRTG